MHAHGRGAMSHSSPESSTMDAQLDFAGVVDSLKSQEGEPWVVKKHGWGMGGWE